MSSASAEAFIGLTCLPAKEYTLDSGKLHVNGITQYGSEANQSNYRAELLGHKAVTCALIV